MTLREPRGAESDEELDEGLGIKSAILGDKETSGGTAFPPTPFLLVEEFQEKDNRYFVVESWEESDIQVLRDCHFMQNIEFKGHKASKEEIEEFSRGDNK